MSNDTPIAHESAYEAFWNELATGGIVPGQQVSEESLSIRWKVGRMPVRDALVRLEAEGLVERRHRVGTFVRQVDEQELRELFQIRTVFEGLVLRRVAKIATAEQLDRLDALAADVDAMEYAADVKATVEKESRFHLALVEVSGLRHAPRILELQRLYVRSFRLSMSAAIPPAIGGPSRKHRDLVALLRARDGDGAAALHATHLRSDDSDARGLSVSIQAIDVHAHYGDYLNRTNEQVNRFMSAAAEVVVDRARRCNTCLTVVSPLRALMPRYKADAFAGNVEAAEVVARTDGLLQWVVLNPLDQRTFEQAAAMLATPQCVGIKIHPEEHGYPIRDHGRAIFEFAQEHRAVVLTHSGEERSLPADFVPFANDFPAVRLILAHIGCGWDGDPGHQVRAMLASKHGNVFADTSSASNVMPGLIEWAVREAGAERVLYGTDSPLYSTAMQRARIDQAEISAAEKRAILRDNAVRLLGLGSVSISRAAPEPAPRGLEVEVAE